MGLKKVMLFSGRVAKVREALEREVFSFAADLCRLSLYPVRAVKEIVGAIADGAWNDTDAMRALVLGAFGGPDYREGHDAFLEKRQPRFTFR